MFFAATGGIIGSLKHKEDIGLHNKYNSGGIRVKKSNKSVKQEEQLTPQMILEEPSEEKPYPASEAGRQLGFSTHTLYRWIQRGWLEATPLPNGRYVVTAKEVERLKKLIAGG